MLQLEMFLILTMALLLLFAGAAAGIFIADFIIAPILEWRDQKKIETWRENRNGEKKWH